MRKFIVLSTFVFVCMPLFGCSSRHVYQDASYHELLDRVSIDIAFVVFSPDHNKGLYIIANRNQGYVLKKIPQMLKSSLEKKGVEVLKGNLKIASTAKVIRIEAVDMKRSCIYGTNTYNYGRLIRCDDEVWYKVSLSDKAVGKVVWSSEFKIDGRIYIYKQEKQADLSHQFVQKIIKGLTKAGVLPTS